MLTGLETIKTIREKTDTVFLSFSCGKDSIGAWLECQKHFPKIVPYHLYLVPDLSFVNSSLDYYEEFFKTKIIRLPHPSLPRMLNNFVFQAPENCQIIEQAGIPDFDYLDQVEQTVEIVGYKGEVWSAVGVRTADSPMRRTAIVRYGTINQKQKKFYPIHDWNKERLLNEMKAAKVKLPIDYKLFGRSFDGIDFRFLYPIKKNFPEDYEKIIAAFPLAELEIQRRGFHEKHKQQYGL